METTEEIKSILVEMGLANVAFNLPVKKQIDSMDMTALIIAVEDEWQISITDEDQRDIATLDDLVKLIHMKTDHMTIYRDPKVKPPIDDQIKFIKDFVLDPVMRDAIAENLIAIRLQMRIRESGHIHRFDPKSKTDEKFCLDCGQLIFYSPSY